MSKGIIEALCILMYFFEGYCIQLFFCRFTEPKLYRGKGAKWAVSIVWVAIRFAGSQLSTETNNTILVIKLFYYTFLLFAFCVCWYKGNILLKIFMVVQFISLRELAFFASYSMNYIGDRMIGVLVRRIDAGTVPMEHLPTIVGIISCFIIAAMEVVQGALLLGAIRKIVKTYNHSKKMYMGKEGVFYLLPSVAGVLVAVLVRMLIIAAEEGNPVLLYDKYPALYLIIPLIALVLLEAIVFGFRIYQDMEALQEERAEKIVLANQNAQMQSSIVELEHLYDGIRSVKHDMKNHMTVLRKLIQKKYQQENREEDEEIRHYFDGIYQSVEQLDTKVHTGNAVSDAVVGSKFRYAEKQVKGIRLDADPAYAQKIMRKLQEWKEDYDRWDNTVAASYGMNVAEHQAGKSYVFQLDENGDVANCTVTAPGRITGPSKEEQERIRAEQEEKRKRRVKYIEILRQNSELRKVQEQEYLELFQSRYAKFDLLN